MIVSPLVLDRNVPLIGPPKGGQIGADGDEQEGVGKGGGAGTGAEQTAAVGGCRPADARELPAGEAAVEAVSGGRGRGSAAPQCRTAIEPCSRAEVSAAGAGAGAGEVQGVGGQALRADAGGGALGVRGWVAGRRRDAATLDAGRGAMEPGAQPAAAPTSARAQGALWGDGADGRELSSVAGGARPGRLLDRYGR